MKRVNLFLILLITAIAALIATTALGFAIFSNLNQTNPYSWMGQMWSGQASTNGLGNGMGGMMNQTPAPTTTSQMLPLFGAVFAVLIVVTIVAVIGVTYYLVYPQIRFGAPSPAIAHAATANGSVAYESVTKTLTSDERKVIEVLKAHDGKYLQKYIKSETGLSRLQTHRIIARLSERGIVSLEKTGNTNQVSLANWLNQKS